LDFFAEVTQHIPDPGAPQIRYYGGYSNTSRGQRAKTAVTAVQPPVPPAAAPTQDQLALELQHVARTNSSPPCDPRQAGPGGTARNSPIPSAPITPGLGSAP
jgi:hypothetical protein